MKKTREQLKKELKAQLEEAIERVLDWQEAHSTFTLTELEDFVLTLRREMGGEIAEAMIGQLGSKVIPEGLHCEACDSPMTYKGQEAKRVETQIGSLAVERGRYWCPTCQVGVFPPG
jgi:hypothetical protein